MSCVGGQRREGGHSRQPEQREQRHGNKRARGVSGEELWLEHRLLGHGWGSGCVGGSGSEGRLERLASDPGSLESRGQESVFSQRPGVSHASCPWFTLWESQAISRQPALRPLFQG